jgi:GTP-binding protein HflX
MARSGHSTGPAPERAVVVAVDLQRPDRSLEAELAEYEALIEATGAVVADPIVQRLPAVDPGTLVGSGKAREIAERAAEIGATKVFVFNDLRPRQRTNLEKIIPLPIVDRSMVILDIFAQRARSREGQLQVELAQLRHRQANLIGVGAALSRLGGGVGRAVPARPSSRPIAGGFRPASPCCAGPWRKCGARAPFAVRPAPTCRWWR